MKILLSGYTGKMGQLVYNSLKDKYNFTHLVDIKNKYNKSMLNDIDVVLDFSNLEFSYNLIIDTLSMGKRAIVGTTGFTEHELLTFQKVANKKNTGISVIYNFDKSLYLLINFLKQFDNSSNKITITDYHHYSKKDCPSGTSILLLSAFKKAKVQLKSYRVQKYIYKHVVEISGKTKIVLTHEIKDKSIYLDGIESELKNIMHIKGLNRTLS